MGSEMCIRDRRSSPWSLGSAPPLGRRACSKKSLKTTQRVPGFQFRRKLAQRGGHHVPIQGWSDVQVHGLLVLHHHLGGEPAQKVHRKPRIGVPKVPGISGRRPHPPRLLTRTWVYVSGFGNPARAIISICLVLCNQDPTTKQGSKQDPTARGIPQWEPHLSTHVWVCPGLVNHIFSVFADLSVLRNQGNFSCRQALSLIHI